MFILINNLQEHIVIDYTDLKHYQTYQSNFDNSHKILYFTIRGLIVTQTFYIRIKRDQVGKI